MAASGSCRGAAGVIFARGQSSGATNDDVDERCWLLPSSLVGASEAADQSATAEQQDGVLEVELQEAAARARERPHFLWDRRMEGGIS